MGDIITTVGHKSLKTLCTWFSLSCTTRVSTLSKFDSLSVSAVTLDLDPRELMNLITFFCAICNFFLKCMFVTFNILLKSKINIPYVLI